jgi:hypothetical protein
LKRGSDHLHDRCVLYQLRGSSSAAFMDLHIISCPHFMQLCDFTMKLTIHAAGFHDGILFDSIRDSTHQVLLEVRVR